MKGTPARHNLAEYVKRNPSFKKGLFLVIGILGYFYFRISCYLCIYLSIVRYMLHKENLDVTLSIYYINLFHLFITIFI